MANNYQTLVSFAKRNASDPLKLAKILTAWQWTSLGPGHGPEPTTASDVPRLLEAICGWRDYLLRAVMNEIGVEGRRVSFYNVPFQVSHAATELLINGKWVFFDATFGTYFESARGGHALSYAEARAQWPNVIVKHSTLPGWQHSFVDLKSINPAKSFAKYTDAFFYHPISVAGRTDSISGEINSLYFGKKVTYNDDRTETPVADIGVRWRSKIDSKDAYSWREHTATYDTAGRLDVRHGYNDDGSTWFDDWDQKDQYAWAKRTTYVSANLLFDRREVVYDDGSRLVMDSDQANAHVWSSMNTYYAASKKPNYQTGTYDDGRSWFIDWDDSSSFAWRSYRDEYDVAGRLVLRVFSMDDGTVNVVDWSAVATQDGTAGNDTLIGDAGANYLRGSAGHDILIGYAGSDRMEGGAGNDLYYVDDVSDDVSERNGSGVDTVYTTVNYIMPEGIENLILLDGALDAAGNSAANTITGNSVRNILTGAGGNDKIAGLQGNDLISGGAGNDTLDGGAGADTLYGNIGTDVFLWRSISDTGTTTAFADRIMDFSSAAGDRIHLASIDAKENISGNQAFTFIGTAAFSAPGQIRYGHSAVDTLIYLNTDSDKAFEGLIRIKGIHNPTADWFVL